MSLRLARVELAAPAALLGELAGFYADFSSPDELVFRPSDGAPFYHFAFVVPGDGFEAAMAWGAERAELLGHPFDFDFWDARACYFHDPAGNIVELIAHREITGEGPILGISEIGVVTADPPGTVRRLEDELGLELWSGDPAGLGFVGRKAHTLITASIGRGWLPTGRESEPHPVDVTISGTGREGELTLSDCGSVIRVTP
jgi:catechol 2,3-dioxygenase-like lactoylglutathione lyase family enzyme